ncbi:hypothetical protein COJ46_01720 [Bacillus sp. AFS077874]|nr:hypothetical protein CON00_04320 [Bacillus sp. AFS096315]PFM83265.1 hypothetical protein COJ46_01720 [Bacillus sp. AFS077874]
MNLFLFNLKEHSIKFLPFISAIIKIITQIILSYLPLLLNEIQFFLEIKTTITYKTKYMLLLTTM